MKRFCCTYGRGTYPFVSEELENVGACEVQDEDGKVFFCIPPDIDYHHLLGMKTVERLFYACHLSKAPGSEVISAAEEVLRSLTWSEVLNAYAELFLEQKPIEDETECKRRRVEHVYRLSVRLRPKRLIKFTQSLLEVARSAITKNSEWQYSTENFDVEIVVHVNTTNIFVGIPVTKQPLSKRTYLKHIGLRSTVSFIIGKQMKPDGLVVLDPMCGCATILCEAARDQPRTLFLGMDNDWEQAVRAKENALLGQHIDIVCADAAHPPFRSAVFDAICCDLPFGIKHSRLADLPSCYRLWLTAWRSLLRHRATLALLTSETLRPELGTLLQELYRAEASHHALNLGDTAASLVRCEMSEEVASENPK